LDNSTFLPKTSASNQESPGSDGEGNGDPSNSNSESEDPDEQFRKLSEMFANKGKSSSKPKASNAPQKRTKKVVEIGPSGQSYTPLELQVDAPILAPFIEYRV
jgi:DNA mismatch repair protein MSH3